MGRVKYSQFEDRIDVPELCNAIGFNPEYEDARGNLVGYCLWPDNHSNGDTTGKFAIHPEKKVYNCYVCGGGSLLSLVMELYSWDSETAEDYLRQFAGDARDDVEFVEDFLNAFANDAEKRVEVMPYFNPRVLSKYEPAYEWGESEGLRAAVIEQLNVLYAPEHKKPSPPRGKFAEDDDYEGPAILWPHYWNGRLVGWQARWLDEDRPQWVAKWTNTVDFPKDNTIYGWEHRAGWDRHFVVESGKSVAKLKQIGYSAFGTFGSNVNEAQLRLLRRFKHLVLIPDNDKGGGEWYLGLKDYLHRYVQLEAVSPLPGEKADPAGGPDGPWEDNFVVEWIAENTVDLDVPLF